MTLQRKKINTSWKIHGTLPLCPVLIFPSWCVSMYNQVVNVFCLIIRTSVTLLLMFSISLAISSQETSMNCRTQGHFPVLSFAFSCIICCVNAPLGKHPAFNISGLSPLGPGQIIQPTPSQVLRWISPMIHIG